MSKQILPPLLFPSNDRRHRTWMKQLKSEAKIRRIGPRLYTSVQKTMTARTVRENWATIIANLFPNALLSYRSALEYRPTGEGVIYLTGTTSREIHYPGLVLKFIRGPKALADDSKFLTFQASSLPRALLENLSLSRDENKKRSIPITEIEAKLEQIIIQQGEAALNQIRDRAKEIADKLGWKREFKKLDMLVGALLGTRQARALQSPTGRARAVGAPYDPKVLTRLESLFAALRHHPFQHRKDEFRTRGHFNNQAFFEAYFSNYIEGTTFEIKEAEEIIFDKKIPKNRPNDAHDVLNTYHIVSDPNEMRKCPFDPEQFHELLRSRHRILMSDRAEALPGRYKEKANRAGSTEFVHPDYVKGTLNKGFEYYQSLPPGLARASFMMFMITEVHPFADGNGRIARIMLNAELYAKGLTKIIIPTVFREDYLSALRALSRRDRPEPLIKMIQVAHNFSCLEFAPYPVVLKVLQERNWFEEPNEAKIIF